MNELSRALEMDPKSTGKRPRESNLEGPSGWRSFVQDESNRVHFASCSGCGLAHRLKRQVQLLSRTVAAR